MNRYILITIASLFLSTISLAQNESSVELYSDIGFFNTAIDARTLLNSFTYIDQEQKDAILNSLEKNNSFHIDIHNSIHFEYNRFHLSFGNHVSSFGIFDKNLVNLVLNGNFSSDEINYDLTPLEGNFYHYSDIGFGYDISEKLKTTLSLIAGHQFISGEVSEFNFNSGSNGQYVNYDLSLEGYETGNYLELFENRNDYFELNNLQSLYRTNGRGMSLSLDYESILNDFEYSISLSDLGFIKWGSSTNKHNISTSQNISPLEIDDFSQIQLSNITNQFDSLRAIINPTSGVYTFVLPPKLNSSFSKEFLYSRYADSFTFSLEHRVGIYPMPRLAVDFHKSTKKHEFVCGYHLGGLEKNGLQFKYNYIADCIHLQLFTRQASIFDLNSMYGVNVGVGVKFLFAKKDKEE